MRACVFALALAAQGLSVASAAERPAEVMHFWVSGSERAALDVVQAGFTARGGVWMDNPQKNDLEMREVLMQRLTTGTAPTALQWHGSVELREMARTGLVANIDDVATRGHWEAVLPAAVKAMIMTDGHYYLAPTGIHTENWIFYNMHVLADHGIAPPHSWADLLAAADKLEAAGVTPIAMGPADWEGRVMWSSILLGTLGREDFRKLFDDKDVSVLDHPQALDAMRIFARLSRHVGPDATRPKDWAAAAADLAGGRAAFQFQGDWAKGELQKQGLVAGRDFGCMLAPGGENALAIVIDAFAFPLSLGDEDVAVRGKLAETIMDPEVQIGFNAVKGSVPARLDTPPARLDPCARVSLNLLADPKTPVNPPAQALDTAAFADVEVLIRRMLHEPGLEPEAALGALKVLLGQMRRS